MHQRYVVFHLFFFNDTATTEIYTLSLHDALPIWSGKGADPRKVANPRESAGAVVQAPVCSDVRAVQLHGQRDEGGVIEGEAELAPQTGGALQKRCSRRGHDEGELIPGLSRDSSGRYQWSSTGRPTAAPTP